MPLQIRRALISVSDKTGIEDFAQTLVPQVSKYSRRVVPIKPCNRLGSRSRKSRITQVLQRSWMGA